MITRELLIRCLGLAVLALPASACRDESTASVDGERLITPELPSEAPLAAGAAGDSPGKPMPPLGIRYQVLGEPQVGQPLQIRITSQAQIALSNLGVEFRGDERLYVAPSTASIRVARMQVDEPIVRTVTVTPMAEGLLRLSVLLQGEVDGRVQARSVTIPIQVGAIAEAPPVPGTLGVDADGEPIISLPAQER